MFKYFVTILLIQIFINPAYAEKKGLPQLDFSTYPSLILWSIISLIILYLIMSYIITPKISNVINYREQNIQNDLIKAKSLKFESDKIIEKINSQLDQTKLEAKSIIDNSIIESQKESENKINAINTELLMKIDKSVHEISTSGNAVIKSVFDETYQLSHQIIAKTSNLTVDKTKLISIVKHESKLMS